MHGWALVGLGEHAAAVGQLRAAVRITSATADRAQLASARLALGRALRRQGDGAAADEHLVVRADPRHRARPAAAAPRRAARAVHAARRAGRRRQRPALPAGLPLRRAGPGRRAAHPLGRAVRPAQEPAGDRAGRRSAAPPGLRGPAHPPAQPALRRGPARRAAVGGGRAGAGRRRRGPVQVDQRRDRPPRWGRRPADGRPNCSSPASATPTRCAAGPVTSSSSCCPTPPPSRASGRSSASAARSPSYDWSELGLDFPVTISVGIASAARGDDRRTLFAAADGVLYDAKRSGRDRVVRLSGVTQTRAPESSPLDALFGRRTAADAERRGDEPEATVATVQPSPLDDGTDSGGFAPLLVDPDPPLGTGSAAEPLLGPVAAVAEPVTVPLPVPAAGAVEPDVIWGTGRTHRADPGPGPRGPPRAPRPAGAGAARHGRDARRAGRRARRVHDHGRRRDGRRRGPGARARGPGPRAERRRRRHPGRRRGRLRRPGDRHRGRAGRRHRRQPDPRAARRRHAARRRRLPGRRRRPGRLAGHDDRRA